MSQREEGKKEGYEDTWTLKGIKEKANLPGDEKSMKSARKR